MAKNEVVDSFRDRGLSVILMVQQPNETVRGWAYRLLLENIIHLNLPPGTFITEQEFANVLRASRTPVREALIQLSNDGFVEITSQRGTRISLIDAEYVEDNRYLRMCLEQKVARLACETMSEERLIRLQSLYDMHALAFRLQDAKRFFELDEEFHQNIFASCGKGRLWDVIYKISGHLIRARVLNINSGYPKEWERVLKQHGEILDAFKRHDPDAASASAETHLSRPGWDVGSLRERYADYFVPAQSHNA
jgi:DNA-binding GntR family transcriptional regulator